MPFTSYGNYGGSSGGGGGGSFWSSLPGIGAISGFGNIFGSVLGALGAGAAEKRKFKNWEKATGMRLDIADERLKPQTPYYNMASNNMAGFNDMLGRAIAARMAMTTGQNPLGVDFSKFFGPAAAPKKAVGTPTEGKGPRYRWTEGIVG